jgi:putative ABC transport system ATP-binding protein
MSAVVDLQNVCKTFPVGQSTLSVLDMVTFSLIAGERIAIVGPSGSGKSTLLGLMAGLDKPTAGRVLVDGHDLSTLSAGRLATLRGQRMGFIFQSFRLLPTLTAEENVAVPLELAGHRDALSVARQWLARVGLENRLTHLPSRLSGGEQQRVALARAMAPVPAVLFADEPTGNLDSRTGTAMANMLFEVAAEQHTTVILVTHDAQLAARTQRCITLQDGRIVSDEATPTVNAAAAVATSSTNS